MPLRTFPVGTLRVSRIAEAGPPLSRQHEVAIHQRPPDRAAPLCMAIAFGLLKVPSEPLEVEIVVELEGRVVPVPDAYALRGQGQLAFNQVSDACKVTTKLGAEEWG